MKCRKKANENNIAIRFMYRSIKLLRSVFNCSVDLCHNAVYCVYDVNGMRYGT